METETALAIVLIVEGLGFLFIAPAMTRRALRRELREGRWDLDIAALVERVADRSIGKTARRILAYLSEPEP